MPTTPQSEINTVRTRPGQTSTCKLLSGVTNNTDYSPKNFESINNMPSALGTRN